MTYISVDKRNPVLSKVEGENWHLRLSSDLHTLFLSSEYFQVINKSIWLSIKARVLLYWVLFFINKY